MTDHVHILIDCNPRFGVEHVVKLLKGKSSRILRDEFPEQKRKLPTLWTRAAFISSVGAVSLSVVQQYIENQTSFLSSFSCLMQCLTPALYIRSVILIILFSLSYPRSSVIIRLVTTKDGVVFFAI